MSIKLPQTLIFPNKIWFKFGLLLGSVVAPIILGILYFITVVPTGLIMRLLGKDLLNQKMAKSIVKSNNGINILCGRFEGIDERLIKEYKILEVSVGDYVLSSGDLASFAFIDCCLRYVSGYVSNEDSLQEESFGEGNYEHLLEYPHYTKPLVWKSDKVPEILISGDHKKIFEWRLNQAKKNTKNRRPDLWTKYLNGVKK